MHDTLLHKVGDETNFGHRGFKGDTQKLRYALWEGDGAIISNKCNKNISLRFCTEIVVWRKTCCCILLSFLAVNTRFRNPKYLKLKFTDD